MRTKSDNESIRSLAQLNGGELPAHAFPGGYPMFYIDTDNNVLCPTCANKALKDPEDYGLVYAYSINYEDGHLHCDTCSGIIEAAYDEI